MYVTAAAPKAVAPAVAAVPAAAPVAAPAAVAREVRFTPELYEREGGAFTDTKPSGMRKVPVAHTHFSL